LQLHPFSLSLTPHHLLFIRVILHPFYSIYPRRSQMLLSEDWCRESDCLSSLILSMIDFLPLLRIPWQLCDVAQKYRKRVLFSMTIIKEGCFIVNPSFRFTLSTFVLCVSLFIVRLSFHWVLSFLLSILVSDVLLRSILWLPLLWDWFDSFFSFHYSFILSFHSLFSNFHVSCHSLHLLSVFSFTGRVWFWSLHYNKGMYPGSLSCVVSPFHSFTTKMKSSSKKKRGRTLACKKI
jgi:hypothetical protein